MASFIPSSSTSFTYSWTYDVFLSFRGGDTRRKFTGNLYKSLSDKGIRTFIDDKELEKGEEITPALIKNIKESRIAIVVFSKDYASSSFCLDELATIMESIKGNGRLVLPVFYEVDPSDVRHQKGSYGEAMTKHEKRYNNDTEKLQKWRKAMRQAADLSGEHVKIESDKYEYESIGEIVKVISNKINRQPLHIADYPVGLESQVLEVNSLLKDEFDGGALMVGIHGIGGIGKSTLARAVFNSIADQFEGSCFLENVRERLTRHGLEHLQETLLSEMLHDDNKLSGVYKGIPTISQRLSQKKVLLILDDVDKPEQLKAVAGAPNWFGVGSRVIIITRDKQLLASHGVEITYEVTGLNAKDAVALLTWNAFKKEKADPSYRDVIMRAVRYASGLPLAFEIIGSNLYGKRIDEWRSALDQYERIPNKKIQKILQISFDALEESEKQFFLDIVCCYNGFNAHEVKEVLDARHGTASYGLSVLNDKSLIKTKYGIFWQIHDLILDMGREVIRQESLKHPGKRSRLWISDDVIHVLKEKTGTSEIEIMILDPPTHEKARVEWDGEAFMSMKNLQVLIIRNACFLGDVKYLPNSLRILEWWNYPSKSLPSDFHPMKLVIFKLSCSIFESFVGFVENREFNNLTVLKFDESNIRQIPDVSSVPNLKVMSFEDCKNIIEVHESVGSLIKLYWLGVRGCSKLRTFPNLNLPSLLELDLSECSSLLNFPETSRDMKGLKNIKLSNTSITKLPLSFKNVRNLSGLEIDNVHGTLQLPSSIGTLPLLDKVGVSGCDGLVFYDGEEEEEEEERKRKRKRKERKRKRNKEDGEEEEGIHTFSYCNMDDESVAKVLSLFHNMVELDLSGNNFTFLPESIKELFSVKVLNLSFCKKLEEIRGIPPNIEEISLTNCTSLNDSSRSMLLDKELHSGKKGCFFLPKISIPEWFEHRTKSNSISFWFRKKLPPFSVSFIGEISPDVLINGTHLCISGPILFGDDDGGLVDAGEHITIFDKEISFEVDKLLSKNEWNHVQYRAHYPYYQKAEFGIHIHKDENYNMEDISFIHPLLHKNDLNMTDDSLNDDVNGDSTLMQTSSSTNIQGTPDLSKDKGKGVAACSQNSDQNSMKLGSTSDTSQQGSCHDGLDYGSKESFYYHGPSNVPFTFPSICGMRYRLVNKQR